MNALSNLKEDMRKALMQSFQPKHVPGKCCITCGAKDKKFGLHMLEFYHNEALSSPASFLPTSNSHQTTRGLIPLCTK